MGRRDDYEQVAEGVPFDNTDNDFPEDIDDVQEAIEYAKANAEGFPRAGLRSVYNGTLSDNEWMGPSDLLPNTPLAQFPVKTKLNEITWGNRKNNVSFRIQFRRGSKTGTIFYTLTVSSPNSGYGYVDELDFEFDPGEVIYAQYLDDGKNCADMDLVLWISRIPE